MSGLAELNRRVGRLKEIRGIMTAMKSLSLVESRKLARFIDHQRRMLANIEAAASDFVTFFPVPAHIEEERPIVLVIGSERGFCGNFNERLLAAVQAQDWPRPPQLIAIGRHLQTRLDAGHDARVIARFEGSGVTEDVPSVLDRIMDAVRMVGRTTTGDVALLTLAHGADGEPALKRLLPLTPASAVHLRQPPQIQLPAAEFFAGLLDQYLLAALHGLIYESMVVENRQRQAHMEYALDHLGETLDALALKRNALRQERIIEEIEVMLSSELAMAGEGRP